MKDCFALLGEPRRPWLDPDKLKEKFLARSAELHPDRVHTADDAEKRAAQDRYTELNAAYHCLREPKERLRHLLELELESKPQQVQRIPANLMDLSMQVAQLCRETDAFLAEKAKTSSPLLQVQLFEKGEDWREKLAALKQQFDTQTEALLREIKSLDADWPQGKDSSPSCASTKRLEELCQLSSYFSRWEEQIRERMLQLSF